MCDFAADQVYLRFMIHLNGFSGVVFVCTGAMDEGEFAREDARLFFEQTTPEMQAYCEAHISQIMAEGGFLTPTDIWETQGFWNNGSGVIKPDYLWDGKQQKYPAYNSVAMFFDEEPPKEVLDVLKARAKAFRKRAVGGKQGDPVALMGFRLLEIIRNAEVEPRTLKDLRSTDLLG